MFERIEEGYVLLDANLLAMDGIDYEKLKGIKDYVAYCQNFLEYLYGEVKKVQEFEDKVAAAKTLEKHFELKIFRIISDMANEMNYLQEFLLPLAPEDEKANEIFEDIDGVLTLLMLIPDEIEKFKLVLLAFTN